MFYYLYQITNLVNNKIYVGVHKTKNMNDGYMGSGKVIANAIEKYGIDNFRKDILETFDNSEAMYAREKEVVNDNFLLREDVYNLRRGGYGGFDYINANLTDEQRLIRSNAARKIPLDAKARGGKTTSSSNMKKAHAEGKIKYDTFTGKKHTEETKKKMRQSHKLNGSNLGEKNSQYGTTWIWCKELGNKKIKKQDLQSYIDSGWEKTYKPGYRK